MSIHEFIEKNRAALLAAGSELPEPARRGIAGRAEYTRTVEIGDVSVTLWKGGDGMCNVWHGEFLFVQIPSPEVAGEFDAARV